MGTRLLGAILGLLVALAGGTDSGAMIAAATGVAPSPPQFSHAVYRSTGGRWEATRTSNKPGTLSVREMGSFCTYHRRAIYRVTLRGYIYGMPGHGPAGAPRSFVRLYAGKNPRAFHADDQMPFFFVDTRPQRSLPMGKEWIVRGTVTCMIGGDQPNSRGSIVVTAARTAADDVWIDTVDQGIRLVLTAAHRRYPRDALIRVHLHVQNLTSDLVVVDTYIPSGCRLPKPYVDGGDPLSGAPHLIGHCPGPLPLPRPDIAGLLMPGGILRSNVYAAVTGRLRGRVTVARYHRCDPRVQTCTGTEHDIMGRRARFSLFSQSAPTVVSHVESRSWDMQPPPGATGRLYVIDTFTCPAGGGSTLTIRTPAGGYGWRAQTGNRVHPQYVDQCTGNDLELHAAAGWLGYPIAHIDYRSPAH